MKRNIFRGCWYWPWRPWVTLAAALLYGFSALAQATSLPEPAALQQILQQPPQTVQVVEPHLSTQGQQTRVDYRGWPAEPVLDAVLGRDWRTAGQEIEFRALDGYVSRIPVERFTRYRAYLVFERIGQPAFTVDNLIQNQKNVPLGPYYLVWDNIQAPELVADGGTYWPYQAAQIRLSVPRLEALLPGPLAERYAPAAADAQKYCLSCHQINGFGGEKWPGNLAQQVQGLEDRDFLRWVLEPSRVKPGTTMPPLLEGQPPAKREALAKRLLEYLKAVPVASPSAEGKTN
ncbi:MAG: cytochrome c family protein [Candidatus Contendobacter sp.]|jgi:hypothetical protein|nr:cytochrome c family protein [Gammaproteobacteria bacterium]MCC8995385.1 cytochrome c family protein [Candidatus Contendobacter sp.]